MFFGERLDDVHPRHIFFHGGGRNDHIIGCAGEKASEQYCGQPANILARDHLLWVPWIACRIAVPSFIMPTNSCKRASRSSGVADTTVICPSLRPGFGALLYKCRCAPRTDKMPSTGGTEPIKFNISAWPSVCVAPNG